jgi:hypothetical protein
MTNDDATDINVHRPAAIIAGAILLLIGGMLLFHWTPARRGDLVAPLVLIVFGTSMVVERGGVYGRRLTRPDGTTCRGRRGRRSPTSGLWLIGVGAWMLASQSHIFGLSFDTSWPLLVIMGGVLLVVRGLD